jgi:phosphoglycolate phosphatase
MSRPYDAVIFDLDGTLVDSAPDIHAAALAMLKDHGLPPITFEQGRSYVGHGVDIFVKRLRADQGLDDALHAGMVETFLQHYEGAVALSVLYPGVQQTLDLFAARGLVMGLCTNKPMSPTRAVLEHFGWQSCFGTVLGGDSLPTRKPDPAPLLRAVADLRASNVLYVGDSEVDAETAQRAGVDFALFTEGYRKAPVDTLYHTYLFSEFVELPALAGF